MIPTAIARATITIPRRSNQRIMAGNGPLLPINSRRRTWLTGVRGRGSVRRRRLHQLGDRVGQILRQLLDVREPVVIGVEPEVQLAVVAHDRDPERLVGRQRHHRKHLLQPPTQHVQRELRAGHVGDDEVEHSLAGAERAAWAMIVGGAKPVSSVRTCAPTACPDSLTPLISSLIIRSRLTGSVSPIGSPAHIAATWLPSAPRSASARTETGTIARNTVSSTGACRRRRYRPRAPATAASTTSLTVPPSPFLTALNCCRSPRTQVNLRWGPIRDVQRAGRGAAQPGSGDRAEAVGGAAEFGGDLARAPQRRAHAARDLGRRGHALQQRIGQQLGAGRQRPRRPLALGRDPDRIRRGVEQHRRDVDAGDPVDERMMGLGQQREAVVGEPLDEPQLPHRT